MKKRIAALPLWVAVAAPALLGQEAPDMAQLQAEIAAAQSAGDNAWMLVCCALVLMMTGPGLLLFYGGLVRRKNVLGTMMQCFILMAVISVLWAVVGYSLAFAEGNVFVGGLDHVFLRGVGMEPSGYAGTIPHYTFMLFQLMFAIITPALITGAFAERMKFSAMLLFMVLWSLVVYAPLAHMVWGSGGLLGWGGTIPAFDFAGGTVVHISSGVSALVCALYLKGRLGYGKVPMPPHSVVLSIIGACLLWVGWFGFNAGSALNAGGLECERLCRNALRHRRRRPGLGACRMVAQRQARRVGRHYRGRSRPGGDHPGRRLRDPHGSHLYWLQRRGDLLPVCRNSQAPPGLR